MLLNLIILIYLLSFQSQDTTLVDTRVKLGQRIVTADTASFQNDSLRTVVESEDDSVRVSLIDKFIHNIKEENVRYLLSSIFQGLAALFAIVITITLLILQQLASRYSADIFSLHFRSATTVLTYLLFLTTLVTCLILLVFVGEAPNSLALIPLGLTITCFVISAKYFFHTVNSLKPSIFLTEIERRLTRSIKKEDPTQYKKWATALTKISEVMINAGQISEAIKSINLIGKVYDQEPDELIASKFYDNVKGHIDSRLDSLYKIALSSNQHDIIWSLSFLRIPRPWKLEVERFIKDSLGDNQLRIILEDNNNWLWEACEAKNDYAAYKRVDHLELLYSNLVSNLSIGLYLEERNKFEAIVAVLHLILNYYGKSITWLIKYEMTMAQDKWIKFIGSLSTQFLIDYDGIRKELLQRETENASQNNIQVSEMRHSIFKSLSAVVNELELKKLKYAFLAGAYSIWIKKVDFIFNLMREMSSGHPRIHDLGKEKINELLLGHNLERFLSEAAQLRDQESENVFDPLRRPLDASVKFYLLARGYSLMNNQNVGNLGSFAVTNDLEQNARIYYALQILINDCPQLINDVGSALLIPTEKQIWNSLFEGKFEQMSNQTTEFFHERVGQWKALLPRLKDMFPIDEDKIEAFKRAIMETFKGNRKADLLVVNKNKRYASYKQHEKNTRIPLRFLLSRDGFQKHMNVMMDMAGGDVGHRLAMSEEKSILEVIMNYKSSVMSSDEPLSEHTLQEALDELLKDREFFTPVILVNLKNNVPFWNFAILTPDANSQRIGRHQYTYKEKQIDVFINETNHVPENETILFLRETVGDYLTEEYPWIEINEHGKYRFNDYEDADHSKVEIIVSLVSKLQKSDSPRIIRINHRTKVDVG